MDAFTNVDAPQSDAGPGMGIMAIAIACATVLCAVSLWIGYSVGHEHGVRDAETQWAQQREALDNEATHWQSVARHQAGR